MLGKGNSSWMNHKGVETKHELKRTAKQMPNQLKVRSFNQLLTFVFLKTMQEKSGAKARVNHCSLQ
jgi:hypothetical protein